MKLVVTRPLPGADATVGRVEAAGHMAIRLPLFGVHPIDWDMPDLDRFDAALLTSSNAVRLARGQLRQLAALPVYAVGQTTAAAAQLVGMNVAVTGKGGAQEILPYAFDAGHRRILWLAGEDRTALTPPGGMTVEPIAVYASIALPVPDDFADRIAQADAVLLHSARAAARLAEICDAQQVDRNTVALGTFSHAIAEAAGGGWRSVVVAEAPNDAALLAAVASGFTATG